MTKRTVEVYSKRRCPICGFTYYDEFTEEKCYCPKCKVRMKTTVCSTIKQQEIVCRTY